MRSTRFLYGPVTRQTATAISRSRRLPRHMPNMDMSTNAASDEQSSHHHDTHAMPPDFIQRAHWRYQTMRRSELESDPQVFDLRCYEVFTAEQKEMWLPVGAIAASQVEDACTSYNDEEPLSTPPKDAPIFKHRDIPGLKVIPGLLPLETQVLFVSCLMHRDLADPRHKTNIQTDYDVPYPPQSERKQGSHRFGSSFFMRERAANEDLIHPKEAGKHKPLNHEQFLYSKLRWLTLGEQYDWPTRSYAKHTTPFPVDLSRLVTGLFPHIVPQSGVVLMYSAKDFMPVHRDVSEQCQRALVSFSVGCDGIFIIARGEDDGEGEHAPKTVAVKVRSGDCIHLDGEARWAWHAMARTIPGTCPPHLANWPVETPGATVDEERMYKKWKGYMGTKRINLSCRQVWD